MTEDNEARDQGAVEAIANSLRASFVALEDEDEYREFAQRIIDALAAEGYTVVKVDALRALREAAWQEGFDAGENMAHLYGHVDHWQDYPTNPYTQRIQAEGSANERGDLNG